MVLYTCPDTNKLAQLGHPCAKAIASLNEAGHSYELGTVKGGTLKFWTWPTRAKDRAEIEQLSGQRSVPILVLDGGEVIVGSGKIVDWAKSNAP
jgi:glutathione S-transferase